MLANLVTRQATPTNSAMSATYVFPRVKGTSWFPGHMAKGLREATQQMKGCNCVIEVLDARISLIIL